MRLRASMCAAPQPDRIDGNTPIEMSGVRLLPGPQPERSRNAAVLMETQLKVVVTPRPPPPPQTRRHVIVQYNRHTDILILPGRDYY